MDKYVVTYRSDAFQTNVVKTVEAHHIAVDAPFVMLIDDDSTPRLIILASALESVELLPADVPASEQADTPQAIAAAGAVAEQATA